MTVTVNDVSFSYEVTAPEVGEGSNVASEGDASKGKRILSHISLTLDETAPLCVFGTSGQGKTTLLRVITGLEKPSEGTVEGIHKDTRMSVLFQEDRLFPHLSVRQNWKIVSDTIKEDEVVSMAAELGLTAEDLDKLPKDLSGGMRRRAAIGRALLFPADIYFMDEPIQGLDEATRLQVLSAIAKHTQGKPLLLITHNEKDAKVLGAKVFRL